MLGCLSIDTFVGGIYNFLGGSRGARGIPFFQQLSTNLLKISQDQASASLCEKTTIVMLTALLELLRREEKTTSHDDLPELIDSLVAFVSIGAIQKHPITLHIVRSKLRELRGIVARAKGILQQEESQANGISTTVDDFFFDAQEIVLPGARHDNDKMDIAEVCSFSDPATHAAGPCVNEQMPLLYFLPLSITERKLKYHSWLTWSPLDSNYAN
jgi:hypothetical protein